MGVPVWNTPSDLGQFFETDNFLIQLDADDTDTYELIVTSSQSLVDPVALTGTKTLIINGTSIQLGSTTAGTIDASKLFGTNTETTDVTIGRDFIVADLNGEDTITTQVIRDGTGVPTFSLTGSATFGTSATNVAVSLTGVGNMTDLINAINAATNNTTYGIEAIDNAGTLQLVKANNYGGDDLYIDTSAITVGDLKLVDGTYYLSLTQIVANINDQLSNTNNVTASVQGASGSYYLRIVDSATAISLSDHNSGINTELQMVKFSSVPRADVATEIDALVGTTGVDAAIVSPNVLELLGGSILLASGTGDSYDILSLLFVDDTGSSLLVSPITEWLIVDEGLGALQGTTPTIDLTTPIIINIRATSSTSNTADRAFSLTLQPIALDKQISWNATNLGEMNEGDVSIFTIDVENFDKISDSSTFYVLRPTDFVFTNEEVSDWDISRATTGTYISGGGTIATANINEPRFEYEYGGSMIGLLSEPTRTNVLLNSEDFTTTWSTSNCNVRAGEIKSPDQEYNGTKLYANGVTSSHAILQSKTGLTDDTDHVFSVCVKANEQTWVRLAVQLKDATVIGAYFDLANITTGTIDAGITANLYGLADGWIRCSIKMDIASGGTTPQTRIYIAEADNDISIIGDSHKGIYIWGAQLEEGAFLTSYIPTMAAPVIRALDIIKIGLYNKDYDITVTSPIAGAVLSIESITTREYILVPNTNEIYVSNVNIDGYHQKTILGSNSFIISNDGDLSGIPPYHTPAPTIQTYSMDVIIDYKNEILLGSNTWSFDVADVYTAITIDAHMPSLLFNEETDKWSEISNTIFDLSKTYKSQDVNFGLVEIPRLPIIYGLTDDTIVNYATAIQDNADSFSVILGDLKVISTDDYDVLYYEIVDGGSSTLSYSNPGPTPITIYPNSIDNLRERLETAIGYETAENLPTWMGSYIPGVVAGFVLPGEGANVLFEFNKSSSNKFFVGREFRLSRLVLTRSDGSNWTTSPTQTVPMFDERFDAPTTYVDASNVTVA